MQRFEKILFINEPPANAKEALQRAVQLARSNEAQLTIINLGQELPRSMVTLQTTFLKMQDEQLQSIP